MNDLNFVIDVENVSRYFGSRCNQHVNANIISIFTLQLFPFYPQCKSHDQKIIHVLFKTTFSTIFPNTKKSIIFHHTLHCCCSRHETFIDIFIIFTHTNKRTFSINQKTSKLSCEQNKIYIYFFFKFHSIFSRLFVMLRSRYLTTGVQYY